MAPEDAPITAQVVYYENDGGLPGTEIGSETVVPTILSSGEWVNPAAYEFITQLDMTPITFNGSHNMDTTYWVEISMGTATNQATVFWAYTTGAGLEGAPMARFDSDLGTWAIPDDGASNEGIYNFSGECSLMDSQGDCTGTPDGRIASVNPEQGNINTTYTVSASGFSGGYDGMTYQWQSNTNDAGWVNEGDSQTNYSAYTATAPSDVGVEVAWRLEVTCTLSSETSYSEIATFTSLLDYCNPVLDCTWDEMITNVTFQEIDNTTACSPDGYGDYTDMIAMVQAAETYPISIAVGEGFDPVSTSVWIDFNKNGNFEEDEFFYIGNGSEEVLTGNISIPAAIENGSYRMRVRVAAVDPSGATWDMACNESQAYGETEDYTVQVVDFDDCSGTPDGGIASVNPESGNINSTYSVTATDYSFGSGITYQWQSNTDGAGWENEGDLLDQYASHTATAPAEYGVSVEWRLEVTCTLSAETSYSETAI